MTGDALKARDKTVAKGEVLKVTLVDLPTFPAFETGRTGFDEVSDPRLAVLLLDTPRRGFFVLPTLETNRTGLADLLLVPNLKSPSLTLLIL